MKINRRTEKILNRTFLSKRKFAQLSKSQNPKNKLKNRLVTDRDRISELKKYILRTYPERREIKYGKCEKIVKRNDIQREKF